MDDAGGEASYCWDEEEGQPRREGGERAVVVGGELAGDPQDDDEAQDD